LVCFDIHFEPPKLKANGVDHLLYAIAWVDNADSTWFSQSLPGIAKKANVNIIGANRSVAERPAWHGYGQSVIIGRGGQILAKTKNDLGNEILYAELFVAERFPSLQYSSYASPSPQIQTCFNLAAGSNANRKHGACFARHGRAGSRSILQNCRLNGDAPEIHCHSGHYIYTRRQSLLPGSPY